MAAKTDTRTQLDNVRQLLQSGKADEAILRLDRCGQSSDWVKNARGVCLMRMGKVQSAIEVLRDLVFGGLICIPSDTPPLYKANYATALLMKNYTQQAIEIIKTLDPQEHPYFAALHETIADWKRGLNPFERFLCMLSYYPSKPILLKFRPGAL